MCMCIHVVLNQFGHVGMHAMYICMCIYILAKAPGGEAEKEQPSHAEKDCLICSTGVF